MAGKKQLPKKDVKTLVGQPQGPVALVASEFDVVIGLIDTTRTRVIAALNHELVELYRRIGDYISRKIDTPPRGVKE